MPSFRVGALLGSGGQVCNSAGVGAGVAVPEEGHDLPPLDFRIETRAAPAATVRPQLLSNCFVTAQFWCQLLFHSSVTAFATVPETPFSLPVLQAQASATLSLLEAGCTICQHKTPGMDIIVTHLFWSGSAGVRGWAGSSEGTKTMSDNYKLPNFYQPLYWCELHVTRGVAE